MAAPHPQVPQLLIRPLAVPRFLVVAASCEAAAEEEEATGVPTEAEVVLPTTNAMTAILGAGLKRADGAGSAMTETEGIGIPRMPAEISFVTSVTDRTVTTSEASRMLVHPILATLRHNLVKFRRLRLLPLHQHSVRSLIGDLFPSTAQESLLRCLAPTAIARPLLVTWETTMFRGLLGPTAPQ